MVLSKPYFDPAGLIVAVDGEQAIGFAHAGFGPSADRTNVDREVGVTCLLMVAAHPDRAQIMRDLLAASEQYLKGCGSQILGGGGLAPVVPFYLGLLGGSELPGVLASDTELLELYRGALYREAGRCLVLQRELAGYRPPVDRQLMQLRRRYNVDMAFDPPAADWWNACTWGQTDRTQFLMRPRAGGEPCGTVTFWDMQPLAASWGGQAAGLFQIEIAPDLRRQGLASFLVGEAMRQLHEQGTTLIEVQVRQENVAALCLFRRLGFEQIDEGLILRKTVD